MKMVVENVVETIASLNTKEEALQDDINDRYCDSETEIMEANERAPN